MGSPLSDHLRADGFLEHLRPGAVQNKSPHSRPFPQMIDIPWCLPTPHVEDAPKIQPSTHPQARFCLASLVSMNGIATHPVTRVLDLAILPSSPRSLTSLTHRHPGIHPLLSFPRLSLPRPPSPPWCMLVASLTWLAAVFSFWSASTNSHVPYVLLRGMLCRWSFPMTLL